MDIHIDVQLDTFIATDPLHMYVKFGPSIPFQSKDGHSQANLGN